MARSRFEQTAEEMTVTLIPQCNSCKFGKGYYGCKVYGEKPLKYRKNKEICPSREERA
ncbi:MAG: hypothetical protein GX079_03950 [Tissierellia bacterium]|nr:hypothetical protein [Tissierellia bacterium]